MLWFKYQDIYSILNRVTFISSIKHPITSYFPCTLHSSAICFVEFLLWPLFPGLSKNWRSANTAVSNFMVPCHQWAWLELPADIFYCPWSFTLFDFPYMSCRLVPNWEPKICISTTHFKDINNANFTRWGSATMRN